jgi:hypothetical protein
VSTLRLVRRGPASKYEIWARYRDPQRWPGWAPCLREVRASGTLRSGLEGEIVGPLGVKAQFDVLEVDEAHGQWTWVMGSGSLRFRVEHEVEEGMAGLVLTGPFPVLLLHAPLARIALGRLVARGR